MSQHDEPAARHGNKRDGAQTELVRQLPVEPYGKGQDERDQDMGRIPQGHGPAKIIERRTHAIDTRHAAERFSLFQVTSHVWTGTVAIENGSDTGVSLPFDAVVVSALEGSRVRIVWIAVALLVSSSCSCSGEDHCVRDDDCFAGEVCSGDGFCLSEADPVQPGGDAGLDSSTDNNGDASEPDDVTTVNSSNSDAEGNNVSNRDVGGDSDERTDSGGDDTGADPESCVVDPFTYQCTDDDFEEDDTWIDGTKLFDGVLGCNPDFVGIDEEYVATMCPLDGSDWFYVDFTRCTGQDWVLEFQLDVTSDCDADLVKFEPLSYECDEPFVDCLEVDGKPTIRMIVDQSFNNLQVSYFQVHTDGRNDVTFDYRVRVSARQ